MSRGRFCSIIDTEVRPINGTTEVNMNFLSLVSERYSVRSYSDRFPEKYKLEYILDAAMRAPTACNNHPEKIFIIESKESMDQLLSVRTVFGAPTAAVICYDPETEWKNRRDGMHGSGETDAAIVTTHMMLAAWEMGIGSCWIGSFDPEAVKAALGIDTRLRVAAILSLGYPSEDSSPLPLHSDNPDKKDKVTYI